MNERERNQLFLELIEQHKGILFKVARTYCQNQDDRADLIQEISIQVWRSCNRYDNKYKISTWLYRIALNVAISFYRKSAKRLKNIIPLDDQTSEIREVDNTENELHLSLLEQFIQELNDLDKALVLLYLEDKSHAEIADIMGISQSNVGTKVGRIKDKLKERFSRVELI